ncbi:MAG TPA: PBP1A family penicillin-binding protein [Gemmatimonadaceae bacterium]|nr:PBP1A family penicillin-binding protein [Gemmatimonadaceae bacterium]
MRLNIDSVKQWWSDKRHRDLTMKVVLAISILAVIGLDSWLVTCGFDRCPTPRQIQSYQPDEGGRIFDRNGKLMGHLEIVRRVNVPISQVPVHVRQAFIATEDRRFYTHHGIDWRGFVRASLRNIRAGGVREGFSTITMQAAQNSFVVKKYPYRSLRQKLIELRLARLMERSLSKDQILQLYMNAIYLGNGVYGVEAASRDLFGKSVTSLTLPEAAMLAALPKAPSYYTPRRSPSRAIARRNLVLSLMVEAGYVSPDRLPGLQATRLRIARDEWRPDTRTDSYALDAVRAIVDSVLDDRDGDTRDLSVFTTLDINAQRAADRAVARRASAIQSESDGYWDGARHSVQGALIALDPRNGDIRALTGGRKYERGNYNRALKAKRQPGSAFKPFVYITALAAGYSPASEVRDEPVEVVQGRSVWTPANYNDDYIGLITFRRALMRSSNAAAVRVSQYVGLSPIIQNAHRMGIQSDIPNYPAVALGALDVTPIELVRAYAPFANGGFRVTPRLVKRVDTRDGDVLWSGETAPLERVIDPRDAYELTSMLRAVVDYGTGRPIRDWGARGMIAGKTGTTNNGTDVWFVGYTPNLVAAVWFGYDDPHQLSYDASGGRLAAPAWAEFYTQGWKEQPPANAWDPPPGVDEAVMIDPTTGWIATDWCPARQVAYFKPGTGPRTECMEHGPSYEEGPVWSDNNAVQRAVEKKADDLGKKLSRALGRIFRF